MLGAFVGIEFVQVRQVEAGAKVVAVAGDHHGAHVLRHGVEERADLAHQRIVERVALGRAVQFQDGNVAVALDKKVRHGQVSQEARHHTKWSSRCDKIPEIRFHQGSPAC